MGPICAPAHANISMAYIYIYILYTYILYKEWLQEI